jgi:hypothetical protein
LFRVVSVLPNRKQLEYYYTFTENRFGDSLQFYRILVGPPRSLAAPHQNGSGRQMIATTSSKGQPFRKMPISRRHLAVLLAVVLPACSLGGCGTINEKLANGAGDYVPQWLGGLPADAPPRPGTAKYDAYMQERERKRLEPAPPKGDATTAPGSSTPASTSPSGLSAVH